MNTTILHKNLEPIRPLGAGLAERVLGACLWLDRVLERQRERRALGALDDRLLADIGVSRTDALSESGKPFWRD
jgi:uncharacterized protein YjiS (DUF1127 family)